MTEGFHPEIINYQTTNFELNMIFSIIVNSLKQLYYCVAKNDPFEKKCNADYPLRMADFDGLQLAFQRNNTFSNHTLLIICLRLFAYIYG